MTQPEQAIKREIRRRLTERGIYWDNVQQGQYSKPGQPDIIACIDGRFVQLEVKTPTGPIRPIQRERGHEIERAGGLYCIVRSTDDLDIILGGSSD